MKKIAVVLVLVFFLGLLSWRFLARPTVEVYAARRGVAVSAIYGTVKVVPSLTFNMRARASGVLRYSEELNRAVSLAGRAVRKGEILGQIINDELDRSVVKAEVEWKAAEQHQELGPADAPALKTQQGLVNSLQKLTAPNNVPRSEFERARNELTALTELVRREQIEIDRAAAVARQEYDRLKDQKALCQLVAPIDGVLQSVASGDGEFVNDGSTLLVVNSQTMFLEGQIDERDVGQVLPGLAADVQLYAFPGKTLREKVTQLRPGANNQRYTVNLSLEQAPSNLLVDMTGEMNIICGERKNALIIPARAFLGDRVWVVGNGLASPRLVKPGFHDIERAEILEGLTTGEQVVVADQDLLHAGQRVRTAVINR